MTLKEWQKREDLQLRVDATLNEPHMQEFMATLVRMGLPDGTLIADININALRNASNEGYFKALSNMELLRDTKPPETKSLPKSWERKAE